ncbi:hypothetical protein QAD02_000722 [Eretmocerus hayati]|uniref:Uncharacterized protein n=1 Tax=Eretmocerus hayati TaxID=131215 RepID=A0ACC2NEV1_9HYME|nr:hypothetical protein QAD02_000722 [Eretmocerus hayati]
MASISSEENPPEYVLKCIDASDDINAQDEYGYTHLIRAVESCKVDLIKDLLAQGADPDLGIGKADPGRPLLVALSLRRADIIRILLDYGADINYVAAHPSYLQTAFSMSDCASSVVTLLQRGLDVNLYVGNEDGFETLLILAVRKRKFELCKLLLQFNPNVNLKDHLYRTALFYPIKCQSSEMVSLLLSSGANPNLRDFEGVCPLLLALRIKSYPIVKSLVYSGADLECVENFSSSGNALQVALISGYLHNYHFILNMQANIHFINHKKENILDSVLISHRLRLYNNEFCCTIFQHLLHLGARLDHMRHYPFVPPDFYAYGTPAMLQILLQQGLQINTNPRIEYEPPLHTALHNRSPELLEYMVSECNLDLENTDENGNTIFLKACKELKLTAIKYLVKFGANVRAKDNCNASGLKLTVTSSTDNDCFYSLLPKSHISDVIEVLDFVTVSGQKEYQKNIVAFLALLQSHSNIPEIQIASLDNTRGWYRMYRLCTDEIAMSRVHRIYDTISVYDMMHIGKSNLIARNYKIIDFVKDVDMTHYFPFYWERVVSKFKTASKYQLVIKRAIPGLSELLCLEYDEHPGVFESICAQLNKDDLLNLAKV